MKLLDHWKENSLYKPLFGNQYKFYATDQRPRPWYRGITHAFGAMLFFGVFVHLLCTGHWSTGEWKTWRTKDLALWLVLWGSILCWTVSAVYHRVSWSLRSEILWQKLDFMTISLKIAMIHTALFLLYMPPSSSVSARQHWAIGATWVLAVVNWILVLVFQWESPFFKIAHGSLLLCMIPDLLAKLCHNSRTKLKAQDGFLALFLILLVVKAALFAGGCTGYLPEHFGNVSYHDVFHLLNVLSIILLLGVILTTNQ